MRIQIVFHYEKFISMSSINISIPQHIKTVIFAYCWTRVTFALAPEFGRKKSIWLMHVSEQTYSIEKNYFSLRAKISKPRHFNNKSTRR